MNDIVFGVIKLVGLWTVIFIVIIIALALIFAIFSSEAKFISRNRKSRIFILTTLVSQWRNLGENIKCARLQKELLKRVHFRQETADRLVAHAKKENPGKPESWYLEKVIYDLKRGR